MLRLPLRPRIAPADGERCWCRCHAPGELFVVAINGMCAPGVARTDPVGAASACPGCLRYHCVALSGRPADLDRAWWRWDPRAGDVVIPLPPNPYAQSDGEGPESL